MYIDLLIRPQRLANQSIYPDTARKIIAKACNDVPLPPLLFNRGEDGKCLQGRFGRDRSGVVDSGMSPPPVVSFGGGEGYLRISAIGEAGRDLLLENVHIIANAVARYVGGAYVFDLREGMCSIDVAHSPCLYRIHRLVMAKKPKQLKRFICTPAKKVEAEIGRIIYRGLLSQAQWIDGNGAQGLERLIPDEQSLGIDIAEGKPLPVEICPGVQAAAYGGLVFSMNLKLKGPWYAGFLRSRGYGLIQPFVGRAS